MAFEVVASAPLIERALEEEEAARPTVPLPFRQLLQISVYWLGINAIMGGIGIAVQERIPDLVPLGEKGSGTVGRAASSSSRACSIRGALATASNAKTSPPSPAGTVPVTSERVKVLWSSSDSGSVG